MERHPAYLFLLAAILMLGFLLRIQAVTYSVVKRPISADAWDYVMYVFNLKHFGIYSRSNSGRIYPYQPPVPDAVRSPGYPLFLTCFIDQPNRSAVKRVLFAQALISGLTMLLGFILFRCFLSPWGALLATLLTAISPHLINANIYLLTECLFAFLVVVTLYLAVLAVDTKRMWIWLAVGAVISMATLVRPALQYFLLVLPLLFFLHYPPRKTLMISSLILAGFVILYVPWTVRNLTTLGTTSDSTLMIDFLHHGMYPGFMYNDDPMTLGYPYQHDPKADYISKSVANVLGEIKNHFQQEPLKYLEWYLLGKPFILWSWNNKVQGMGDAFIYAVTATPYASAPHFYVSHWIAKTLHYPSVVLALIGCVLCWSGVIREKMGAARTFALQINATLLIYFTLLHIIGAPFPRYSFPLRPELYAVAIAGFWLLWVRLGTNKAAYSRSAHF